MNAQVEVKKVTVTIESDKLHVRSGISQKGKPYTIREQEAYIDLGKRFPVETKLNLDEEQPAWPPGEYDIDVIASLYVDRFGGMAISSNPQLVNHRPLKAAK